MSVRNLDLHDLSPGRATALIQALIAVGPASILVLVLAGALILPATALLTSNVVHHHTSTKHWF